MHRSCLRRGVFNFCALDTSGSPWRACLPALAFQRMALIRVMIAYIRAFNGLPLETNTRWQYSNVDLACADMEEVVITKI